jgi:iron-sulfur cluster insertion protein
LETNDKILDNDFVFEKDDTRFVLDDVTLDMLKGSTVVYAEELIGSNFQVENPNAESSCGCKISFNLK